MDEKFTLISYDPDIIESYKGQSQTLGESKKGG